MSLMVRVTLGLASTGRLSLEAELAILERCEDWSWWERWCKLMVSSCHRRQWLTTRRWRWWQVVQVRQETCQEARWVIRRSGDMIERGGWGKRSEVRPQPRYPPAWKRKNLSSRNVSIKIILRSYEFGFFFFVSTLILYIHLLFEIWLIKRRKSLWNQNLSANLVPCYQL